MSSVLIKNGTVVTVDDQMQVHQPGYVYIENDLISAVGSGDAPPEYQDADKIIDANLMAVITWYGECSYASFSNLHPWIS